MNPARLLKKGSDGVFLWMEQLGYILDGFHFSAS